MGLKLLQDQYIHYTKTSPSHSITSTNQHHSKLTIPIPSAAPVVSGLESVIDHELINDMLHSGDVAVNILNDLLMYEKIEGNLLNMEVEEAYIPAVIQDAAKLFKIQVYYNVCMRVFCSTRIVVHAFCMYILYMYTLLYVHACVYSYQTYTLYVYSTGQLCSRDLLQRHRRGSQCIR